MKSLALISMGLLVSFNVFAGSGFSGKISAIVCHASTVSNVCQLQVDGSVSGETCSASSAWKYTFDGTTPEGKNMLSILLAAQASKSSVQLAGLGCNLTASSEDLRHVVIVTN